MHHMQNAHLSHQVSISSVYEKYASMLLTFFWKRGVSTEDAEDLLLEVFTAAIENPRLLTLGEHEQAAWLQRVAHNKMIDLHRRQLYRKTTTLDTDARMLFEGEHAAPEHVVIEQERHVELRRHLSRLSATQQEVIRLRFSYGLSSKEIALHLKKSDAAIRSLLSRAINLLRDIYSESEGK